MSLLVARLLLSSVLDIERAGVMDVSGIGL